MNVMTVAEALGKFEWEVLELAPEEFARWCAYFSIREKEEKKEAQRAKARAGKSR